VWFLTHSCQAFTDQHNSCCSSLLSMPSFHLTLFIYSSSLNHSFWRILIRCYVRCDLVLMMSCMPSSSTVLPHFDRVNLEMYSKAIFDGVWRCTSLATTLVSIRNSRVFQLALMALKEPHTLWQRITCFPSLRQWLMFHTYVLYFAPRMWWRICTIRTIRMLYSLQRLQLCCSHLHNAWWCLWLSLAECHILPLCYCYISDAALCP